MTIRVTIKNDDQSRNVDVIAEDIRLSDGARTASNVSSRLLEPGESADFWIHQTRELRVIELHPDDPRNSKVVGS